MIIKNNWLVFAGQRAKINIVDILKTADENEIETQPMPPPVPQTQPNSK